MVASILRRGVLSAGVLTLTFGLCTQAGETQFVYLTGSGCSSCRKQAVKDGVARAMASVRQQRTESGGSFSTIVIAVDPSEAAGRRFLEEHARGFDHEWIVPDGLMALHESRPAPDAIVKRGALDQGVLDAIWGYRPGAHELPMDGLPQIIVLEKDDDGTRVLFHILGELITLWADQGASLDTKIGVP